MLDKFIGQFSQTQPLARTIGLFLLLIFFYFGCLENLGQRPIQCWDESLFAMRAYYLAETGQYLANFDYFPGISSYFNQKPPLGTWLQAPIFKAFDYAPIGLRLTSSLGVAIIGLLLLITPASKSSNYVIGFVAALVLLSSSGFIKDHIALTGDQDALFALFIFLQMLGAWQVFSSLDHPERVLWKGFLLFSLGTIAAFLIKNIMSFFLFPGYAFFFLFQKKMIRVLRDPYLWIFASSILLFVGGYYWWMEIWLPGFIERELATVWGRYLTPRDGHQLPWYHYWVQFFQQGFFPWGYLMLVGYTAAIFSQKLQKKEIQVMHFLLLLLLSYLLIITFSSTKLVWYDAACYPIAALLFGHLTYQLSTKLTDFKLLKGGVWIGLIIVCAFQLQKLRMASERNSLMTPNNQFAYLMEKLQQERPELKRYTVYSYEYNGQIGFYARWLNDYKGYQIDGINYLGQKPRNEGDYIMVCHEEKAQKVRDAFEVEIIESFGPCWIGQIIEKKER